MITKTYRSEAIVLKRTNYGEADRLVTLFSKDHGKVACLAKGVRRLNSSRRACLEPGTQAVFFFAKGKSLDILTQTKLINSFGSSRQELGTVTQLYQILEIIDKLTVEHQEQPEVYDLLVDMLARLNHHQTTKDYILEAFRQLLQHLGFTYDKQFSEFGLKNYIESLAGRPLRTKAYLTVGVQ